jgi:hypothetical protein
VIVPSRSERSSSSGSDATSGLGTPCCGSFSLFTGASAMFGTPVAVAGCIQKGLSRIQYVRYVETAVANKMYASYPKQQATASTRTVL